MDPEEEKQSESFFNESKEKLKDSKEKIDKTKKAFKRFMKLPTPVKIAILVLPLVIILIFLLLAGATYLLDILGYEKTATAKVEVMGTGATYSKKVIKMDNGKYVVDISDELKQELIDAGINTDGMSQDEILIELLIAHGLDVSILTEEQIETLPYMIKAELASQQLDLRPGDEMYDDSGNYIAPDLDSLGENEIQGTVHVKRTSSKDMSSIILSYVDYATFRSYNGDINEGKKYFSFDDDGDLVIYTWNHNKTTYTSSGTVPAGAVPANTENYYMQETKIDYKSLVNKYSLPFEITTALLVVSEDTDFIKQVADLAFDSNIEISLIEEYEYNKSVNETKYYETIREYQHLDGTVTVDGNNVINKNWELINAQTEGDGTDVVCEHSGVHSSEFTYKKENFSGDENPTYTITEINETESNNYQYTVTLADIWFMKMTNIPTNEYEETYNESSGTFTGMYNLQENTSYTNKNAINNISDSIKREELLNEIQQAIDDVQPPTVNVNGANIEIISTSKMTEIKVIRSDGTLQTFYPNSYSKNLTDYETIALIGIINEYNNQFYFEGINFYKKSIYADYNIFLDTFTYSKTDTKTNTTEEKKVWKVKEGTTKKELYDKKGEKFLKALEENKKASSLLDNADSWLYEMTDEYDSSFTTILNYLLDIHRYGKSDITQEELNAILDVYGTAEFNPVNTSGIIGGSAFWWPIGSKDITIEEGIPFAKGEPEKTKISAGYPTYSNGESHGGIDIIPDGGSDLKIVAIADGKVTYVQSGYSRQPGSSGMAGYGNLVVIEHNSGIIAYYAHLKEIYTENIYQGATVKQGQVLGIMGNTGNTLGATGIHLHFEIRTGRGTDTRQNPSNYVAKENPRPENSSASTDLVEFLHSWEGTGRTPSNGNYYVYDDKDPSGKKPGIQGTLTVGYGVTLVDNKQAFKKAGIDTSTLREGSAVPIAIVDEIEKMEIASKKQEVINVLKKAGITDLSDCQLDALVSRAYNCGVSGALSTERNGIPNFATAYKSFGDTEDLYNNYLCKPITSKGEVLQGLVRRRKAEWNIFHNGIYTKNV